MVIVNIEIKPYDNKVHRSQVIDIWSTIFGYTDKRNDPSLIIDKKLAVCHGGSHNVFVCLPWLSAGRPVRSGSDGPYGRSGILILRLCPFQRPVLSSLQVSLLLSA